MMVIGLMEVKMDKESKLINMELNIGVNGNKIKEKDLGNWNLMMVIIIKVIFKKVSKLVMDAKILKMGIVMMEIIWQINSMEKVFLCLFRKIYVGKWINILRRF